jgi:hypothetical protein
LEIGGQSAIIQKIQCSAIWIYDVVVATTTVGHGGVIQLFGQKKKVYIQTELGYLGDLDRTAFMGIEVGRDESGNYPKCLNRRHFRVFPITVLGEKAE